MVHQARRTNRDKGEPHGSAPLTPPCIRARIRRFMASPATDTLLLSGRTFVRNRLADVPSTLKPAPAGYRPAFSV